MSKKDYIAIAKVIRDHMKNPDDDLISELCRIFAETNNRFDSDRFRRACTDEG
ncbi:MAG: hypothetical protein H8E74_02075 [Gammaproteobacteria bacterium]|nr:hypothetical protein [Gammaproteobacteria bacterium]